MYANGEGVAADYVLAYARFNLAAAQGEGTQAAKNKRIVEKRMTPTQIAEAQKLTKTLAK